MVMFGGIPEKQHIDYLKDNKPHILVGTPGRVLALTKKKILKLDKVKQCVVVRGVASGGLLISPLMAWGDRSKFHYQCSPCFCVRVARTALSSVRATYAPIAYGTDCENGCNALLLLFEKLFTREPFVFDWFSLTYSFVIIPR